MVEVFEDTFATAFLGGDRGVIVATEGGGIGESSDSKKGTLVLTGVQLSEFFPGLASEDGDPVTGTVISLGIGDNFSRVRGESFNFSLEIRSDLLRARVEKGLRLVGLETG